MAFEDTGLTEDAFLGGRLSLFQPKNGYRAGVDPVFLAAATPAHSGESVLELGSGVGTAILCLATRVPGLSLSAIELQPEYAELARRNAQKNGIALEVFEGDVAELPGEVRSKSFNHVILNPPFFDTRNRTEAADSGREAALSNADLTAWIDTAIRRLAPSGHLTMIHTADALPDILSALDARVGAVTVTPLMPRRGKPARRVILRCQKGSRRPFTLLPPTVLHRGDAHVSDGDDYAEAISAVLRDGHAFPWPEP